MSVEETIVQQLQEFRRWQIEQEKKLLLQQKEQIENLSDKQSRMYEVLSQSMEEATLNEQSISNLMLETHDNLIKIDISKEKNLIDLDIPDEKCITSEIEQNYRTPKNLFIENENNNFDLEIPTMKLGAKNSEPESKSTLNYFYDQFESSSDISKTEIQSFFSDNSTRSNIPIDDIPLPSPKKDFETLLEEKLRNSVETSIQVTPKLIEKKPFLKKGEGLARFKPSSNHQNLPKCSLKSRRSSINSIPQSIIKSCKTQCSDKGINSSKIKVDGSKRKSISSIPPVAQEKLTLKNVLPPKKKLRSRSIEPTSNLFTDKKKKTPEFTSDPSSSDLEIKNKREQEEVRIFELLEDKAENSSFCSTSSTVIAFLQQSTPLKHKALLHSASKHKISFNDIGDQTLEEIISSTKSNQLPTDIKQDFFNNQNNYQWNSLPVSTLKNNKTSNQIILPYGTDVDENFENLNPNCNSNNDENNVSLHVRFAEHNEYKNITDHSSISSDSQTIMNYADDKGAWSDCSATDSSDTENTILSYLQSGNMHLQNKKFGSLDFLRKHVVCSEDNETEEETEKNLDEKQNKIDQEIDSDVNNVTLTMDNVENDEKNINMSLFKSELLKTRLVELEQEIEIFRKENAALSFQRQKLLEERTKLQEERISLQKNFREKQETLEIEKKKAETILQEERKRISREKIALENRLKDAYDKSQKNKQERQEIQTLKDQLDELKEEFRQKENKWTATNARQRSQMRVMQTENARLKQELEKLQQQKNARFKKVTSNTKAIHQINKVLANRKKTSPFKTEEIFFNNDEKLSELDDLMRQIDLKTSEENENDQKEEKLKIAKTAESIARTRDLYESLLRDAVEDYADIQIENTPTHLQTEKKDQELENKSFDEIHVEKDVIDNEDKNIGSPKKELEKLIDEKNSGDSNKQRLREVHHPDGHIEYWYPNGNVKKVFPEENLTKIIYYNGDVRINNKNGVIKYFYASSRTWHTTNPDGSEILEYPDGQVEKKSKDGTIEVIFTDGSIKIVHTDGSEKWALNDGTIAETSADGERTLFFPNGQREIHTRDSKRREYPDGTVKFVYPDGLQETRYANGRVRLKDKHGNLIMDSFQQ